MMLFVFSLIAPMCVAAFMNNEVLVGILSFFVNLGYQSLNETAADLEHPFGLGANHLQLTAYQSACTEAAVSERERHRFA